MSEREVIVELGADIRAFTKSMSGVTKQLKGIEKNTKQTADTLTGTFKKVGMMIKGALAFDLAKNFTVGMITATADLEALGSQYEQVMAGMKGASDKYLGDIVKTYNKHPNQLKGAMFKYMALLKGKGVAEKDAFELSKNMLERTVDANAFANESMDATTERFVASIKGEYDSLDTAMVELSATMLDTKAQEQYGKSFRDLSVTQQETLKVQEMLKQHTASGVLDQGIREAESFQNELEMLKGTWQTFLQKMGTPILPAVTAGLKGLSTALDSDTAQAVIESLGKVGTAIKELAEPYVQEAIDGVKGLWKAVKEYAGVETAVELLDKFADAVDRINANKEAESVVVGVASGFAIFKGLKWLAPYFGKISLFFAELVLLFKTGGLSGAVAGLGSVIVGAVKAIAVGITSTIGLIAILVGIVIGAIWFIYNNWATLVEMAGILKDNFDEWWDGIGDKVDETNARINKAIDETFNEIAENISNNVDDIKRWWNGLGEDIMSTQDDINAYLDGKYEEFTSTVDDAIASISRWWSDLGSDIESTQDSINSYVSTKWENLKTTISDKMDGAKRIVRNAIEEIKGFFNFSWKLPEIGLPKLPKLSVTGSFGLNPLSVPEFNFFATGGIIKGSKEGSIVGVGENGGDEAIVPLSNKSRMKPFAQAVARMMPDRNGGSGGDIINNFNIASVVIREEADIKKLAKELTREQDKFKRAGGRVIYGN